MPNQTQTHTSPPRQQIQVSAEAKQAVTRFIDETDWTGFWSRVTERAAVEVDAYEKARVKSLQTAPQHVFM